MIDPVLLVDDDDYARGFARVVLERAGYRVREAADLETALREMAAQQPSAVITDWNLPDGTGCELTQALGTSRLNIPVILITGNDPDDMLSRETACREFVTILQKPFSPSALERAVRQATVR